MAYLIDGHNLIPKIPGLRLDQPDDEEVLITLLQEFCRLRRKNVEVYFDRAAAGHAGKKRYGQVTAHFVREGLTADSAILQRLKGLKKGAKNMVVVSSDRQVIAEAKARGAGSLLAQAFAEMMEEAASEVAEESPRPELSEEEIKDWLELFGLQDGE